MIRLTNPLLDERSEPKSDLNTCTILEAVQTALTYEETDPKTGVKIRRRWMSSDDIQFLISVGLRVLVEECWARRILLVGVVKDSESRYITRNYLGSMKHAGFYKELQSLNVGQLPWTDRIYLETIPSYCDDNLESPWSSIEFDSTFITLHLGDDLQGSRIMGVKTQAAGTEIVAPERLFLRSLAQFFISRSKKTPLMGHVVFLDRLAFPAWDKVSQQTTEIRSKPSRLGIGSLAPLAQRGRAILATKLIRQVRREAPDAHIHCFSMGSALLILLAFYCGADSVDSQTWIVSAAFKYAQLPGHYMTRMARREYGTKRDFFAAMRQFRERLKVLAEEERFYCKDWITGEHLDLLDSETRYEYVRRLIDVQSNEHVHERACHNLWIYNLEVRSFRAALGANKLEQFMEQRLKGTRYEKCFDLVKGPPK